jgi:hypothetical protein
MTTNNYIRSSLLYIRHFGFVIFKKNMNSFIKRGSSRRPQIQILRLSRNPRYLFKIPSPLNAHRHGLGGPCIGTHSILQLARHHTIRIAPFFGQHRHPWFRSIVNSDSPRHNVPQIAFVNNTTQWKKSQKA